MPPRIARISIQNAGAPTRRLAPWARRIRRLLQTLCPGLERWQDLVEFDIAVGLFVEVARCGQLCGCGTVRLRGRSSGLLLGPAVEILGLCADRSERTAGGILRRQIRRVSEQRVGAVILESRTRGAGKRIVRSAPKSAGWLRNRAVVCRCLDSLGTWLWVIERRFGPGSGWKFVAGRCFDCRCFDCGRIDCGGCPAPGSSGSAVALRL